MVFSELADIHKSMEIILAIKSTQKIMMDDDEIEKEDDSY